MESQSSDAPDAITLSVLDKLQGGWFECACGHESEFFPKLDDMLRSIDDHRRDCKG